MLLSAGADVVHLRGGKQVAGRVAEFDSYIEIDTPDGKRRRIDRADIDKIVFEPRLLACPFPAPFPDESVLNGDFDFAGGGDVLVAMGRPPSKQILGFDPSTGARLWELSVEGRAAPPLFVGNLIYFARVQTVLDEKQKLRFQGANVSKDVCAITMTVVSARDGKEIWTQSWDNNDRDDILWTVPEGGLRFVTVGDRVVVRVQKKFWPIDKSRTLDKTQESFFVSYYVCDPEKKKFVKFETAEPVSSPGLFFTEDLIVYATHPSTTNYRVHALALKDGKPKWSTEESEFKPVALTGDVLVLRDERQLALLSLRTGKRVDKWLVEHAGGTVVAVDHRQIYVFRNDRMPRVVLAYDLKNGKELWRIDMPDGDTYAYCGFAGSLLLYTDKFNNLIAYDTQLKKEAWRYTSSEQAQIQGMFRRGQALYLHKDAKLTMLDLATGTRFWQIRGEWTDIVPAGDFSIVCRRRAGADLIREREVPANAVFLTKTRTPLRYVALDDRFTRPAFADGTLSFIGLRGVLYRSRMDGSLQETKISEPIDDPLPPFAMPGVWGVTVGGKFVLHDKTGKELARVPHSPHDPANPYFVSGDKLILATGGGVHCLNWKTGQKVWAVEGPAAAWGFTVAEDRLFVAESSRVHVLKMSDGTKVETIETPAGTSFAMPEGDRLLLAGGPLWTGSARRDMKYFHWQTKAKAEDSGAFRYRGANLYQPGRLIHASLDGRIVALETEKGSELWSRPTPKFTSPIALQGNTLYLVSYSEGLVALDVATGKEVLTVPVPDPEKWTPVEVDGKFHFWTTDGWLIPARP